jgi:peptidoglycan hydrolase CwlO-like protein
MVSIASTAQNGYSDVQNTLVAVSKLTPEDLKTSQSQLTIAQKESSVKSAQAALINLNNDLESLRKNLELTKNSYETKITQQQFDIKNAENTLAISQESLKLLIR